MTATLLDSTLGGAAMNSLPPHLTAVTSQLNIHYLRPGKGSFMRCIAKIVHKGKQLIVLEGEAFDDQERLLAKATATFLSFLAASRHKKPVGAFVHLLACCYRYDWGFRKFCV